MINTICYCLFLIGAVGLILQMLLGSLHVGHGARGGHAHGHGGHAIGNAGARGGSGGARGARIGRGGGMRSQTLSVLLTILSPMTLFSFCLGTGATGLILHNLRVAPGVVAPAAILAGLLFYGLIIKPMSNLIFRFASTPSTTLEGAISHDAEVVTRFNEAGEGIVRVNVDGQLVRILARLESDDRPISAEIAPGDRLTVTSVDGHTNTCRVARL